MDRVGRAGALFPLAVIVLFALMDFAAGPRGVVLGLVVIGPLLAASITGCGLTTAYGALAFVVAVLLGFYDGQYSPEVLPDLLRELDRRGLDLLQGSRIAGGGALAGGMPLYKYAGNGVLNKLERVAFGLPLTDFHSGYLVYGPRALATIPFERLGDSFDFDLEVIAAARARGLAVGEAPIPTHYGDEISYLNPLTYGLRVLRVMWRFKRGAYAPERKTRSTMSSKLVRQ